jgi:transcriptional regulator
MYIPSFNKFDDYEQVLAFMRKYSFGTIISAENNVPVATHLPFLIDERDGNLFILSHFAKANPQASSIGGGEVLVIFTEPHAYISPKNYEKETNVPTWNYIAVHAYGKARIMESEQGHMDLLERTISYYDANYQKQWDGLPEKFKSGMIKGITGFEIMVTDLQAKSKLSQNRSEIEKEHIINSLSKSDNTQQKDIAKYMAGLKRQ